MSTKEKIKRWYRGGPLPTQEKISETATIYRMPDTYEPSLPARFTQFITRNILAVISILVAVVFGILGLILK